MLKKKFGRHLTFWGGGCDTQRVLNLGSPQQVRAEVRRRIADLCPEAGSFSIPSTTSSRTCLWPISWPCSTKPDPTENIPSSGAIHERQAEDERKRAFSPDSSMQPDDERGAVLGGTKIKPGITWAKPANAVLP